MIGPDSQGQCDYGTEAALASTPTTMLSVVRIPTDELTFPLPAANPLGPQSVRN
jgi:hypothetical protein